MKKVPTAVRAWKDPMYRESLSEEQKAHLPANPVGLSEFTDVELALVSGVGDGPFGGDVTGTGADYYCACAYTETGTGEGVCYCECEPEIA